MSERVQCTCDKSPAWSKKVVNLTKDFGKTGKTKGITVWETKKKQFDIRNILQHLFTDFTLNYW